MLGGEIWGEKKALVKVIVMMEGLSELVLAVVCHGCFRVILCRYGCVVNLNQLQSCRKTESIEESRKFVML